MDSEKPRFFLGFVETSNLLTSYAEAIRRLGFTADTVLVARSGYYLSNEYTVELGLVGGRMASVIRARLRLFALLFSSLRRYDVFLFFSHTTFLPFHVDLFLLRLLRKRIIYVNTGDDVRYRPIQTRLSSARGEVQCLKGLDPAEVSSYLSAGSGFVRSFFRQRFEEWAGCTIVSMRNQATFQGRPFVNLRFATPSPLQTAKAPARRPLVVHAPTDRLGKRTDVVLRAVDRLRQEGVQFDFELIENAANEHVLSRLLAADVAVDQCGNWVGRFATEALAASCVVFAGSNHEFENFPSDSPVIQLRTEPDELARDLRAVLVDTHLRAKVMSASYAFWKRYYSPVAFDEFFRQLLDETAPMTPPWPDAKRSLLASAESRWQRLIIRMFFRIDAGPTSRP